MPTISPIIRITVGLLLLTISILLIGDMLGLVPNQNVTKVEARKTMSESLAIQISSEVGAGRMLSAVVLLKSLVQRNEDILSIGLRDISKKIILETEGHAEHWKNNEGDKSTANNVKVPIFGKKGRWGTLEVSYKPFGSLLEDLAAGRSLVTMILFIIFSGFLAYWLFLKRVLSELDPGSVVPDRVRSALDTLMEGLVILDQSERIIFVNIAFQKKINLSEKELLGKNLSALSWEVEKSELSLENKKMPWTLLFETEEIPALKDLKFRLQDDELLTFNVNVAPIKEPNQKMKGAIVTINDVTELERKNRELADTLKILEMTKEEISRQNLELVELATKDPLTALLNRRALFEGFDSLLGEARNSADIVSCIILDIDHFKLVNDTYGHGVGDEVIRTFAKILQEGVGANDLVGRYGGEEFVIVFPGLTEEEAAKEADIIRIKVCEKVHDGLPEDLWIAASFGVASTLSDEWKSDNLIDFADKALYVAKENGRNRVVRYSQMDEVNPSMEVSKPTVSRVEKPKREKVPTQGNLQLSEVDLINEDGEISLETFDMVNILSRTVILDRLTQAMKLVSRKEMTLTVLTIVIDNMQPISNALGYASAEKLRKIVYERLINIFRSSDSVIPEISIRKKVGLSRTSDGEFIAILLDIEQPSVTTWVVNRMLKDLAEPIIIDTNEIIVTASVGGSVYPVDSQHAEELITNSNIALQRSKQIGRDSFLFYNEDMNTLCKYELEVESQLHLALKREEFFLNYQPIISAKTGRVDKFEALLRWKHPKLGLVSIDAFIEIAENAGIIKEIGAWVTMKALHQLKKWHESGFTHLKISINLSAVQFYNRELADDIIAITKKVGVSASSVILEMTETALLKEYEDVKHTLNKLDSAGFQIALDDFGTGYSSIEYLRNFPISIIKIDRSLINDFPESTHELSIVSALINLAHNLNMSVIAEGVEKETQLKGLIDIGCNEIQGYIMSRPLLAKDTLAYLASTDNRKMIKRLSSDRKAENTGKEDALLDVLNSPPVY